MKPFATPGLLLCVLAGCAPTAFLRSDPPLLVSSPPLSAFARPAPQGGADGGGGVGQSALDLGSAYRTDPATRGRIELVGEPTPTEAPLLGWNGDVVEAPPGGNSIEDGDGGRGLDPAPGGRTTIIELYQKAIDERDALAKEVEALRRSLVHAQTTLDGSLADLRALEQRAVASEAESQRLLQENEELSARLATAQIRRLEAEKLLLEAQIRWHRSQVGASVSPPADLATGRED